MTADLPPAFDRKFVVVSGKGGVGKSTVAAAIGLAAARAGRRTCVVQLNTRDAIGPLFLGSEAVGYQPVRLDARLPLWGVNLRPAEALREYSLMKLRFRALHKIVFENDVMRRLLRMMPGMTETFLLGKAWHMAEVERDDLGQERWDVLVIDAPSTGHGLSLLRLPDALLAVVSSGPMADDARAMRALLVDPARTAFHVVTLPTELAVTEALALADDARELVGIAAGYVIVNQVLPDLLGAPGARVLGQLRALPELAAAVRDAVGNAQIWQGWRAQQQQQVSRLRRHAHTRVLEVGFRAQALGAADVRAMADELLAAVAHPAPRAATSHAQPEAP